MMRTPTTTFIDSQQWQSGDLEHVSGNIPGPALWFCNWYLSERAPRPPERNSIRSCTEARSTPNESIAGVATQVHSVSTSIIRGVRCVLFFQGQQYDPFEAPATASPRYYLSCELMRSKTPTNIISTSCVNLPVPPSQNRRVVGMQLRLTMGTEK